MERPLLSHSIELLTQQFCFCRCLENKKMYKKTNLKKDRGTDVMMEMGDVFSYLFQLADMLNVDLDMMWETHRFKMKDKKYNLK